MDLCMKCCWLELVEFGSPKKVGKSVVVVSSNYDGNLSKRVVDNAIFGIKILTKMLNTHVMFLHYWLFLSELMSVL